MIFLFHDYLYKKIKLIKEMASILIQFPVRDRFEKFCTTINIYKNRLSNIHNIIFNISIDSNDMRCNYNNINSYLQKLNIKYYITVNDNKTKVEAINKISNIKELYDIIILASDDMIPQVDGYDNIIVNDFNKYYSDFDGVLWYNDGYVGNRLNTLCILGKKYYDRFNYIYHPSYKSVWCDNEFQTVATILNKQTYIDQCIIKHEHFANNTSIKMDQLYIRNESYHAQDNQNYNNRKLINFNL